MKKEKPKFCGYSNCFRPFFRMRGFMPVCEFHFKHPKKWGEDGRTYTGSVWRKAKRFSVVPRWERHHDILGAKRRVRVGLEIKEAKT